ncbi:096bb1d0-dd90-4054-86f3-6fe2cbc20934 [Thermothielavioides terrestris]|uniref:096bb1d0-dd90-4054-86f3-6fe2cbc20934 n=1 Tax=Thermothielavioides terrestris TaxID=2587410 RepID=A0A446BFQ9_9PEZI|nr:096bb1d0-dd90-4054-86f3-6fe2cbc20934 [Thermothielavioides terrestris]
MAGIPKFSDEESDNGCDLASAYLRPQTSIGLYWPAARASNRLSLHHCPTTLPVANQSAHRNLSPNWSECKGRDLARSGHARSRANCADSHNTIKTGYFGDPMPAIKLVKVHFPHPPG